MMNMRLFLKLGVCGCFLLVLAGIIKVQAETHQKQWVSFKQNKPYRQTLKIKGEPDSEVVLQNSKVIWKSGVNAQELYDYSDPKNEYQPLKDQAFVEIADFNFDGFSDIHIYESSGYMGVNVYSNVFVYQPLQKKFTKDKTLTHACNLQKDSTKQILTQRCKTGRSFLYKTFKSQEGGLVYLYEKETAMVGPHHSLVVRYDSKGNETSRMVVDSDDTSATPKPAKLKVVGKQCQLYGKPLTSAKTLMSLSDGETIILQDYKKDATAGENWYKILIEGRDHNIENLWVKADCVQSMMETL